MTLVTMKKVDIEKNLDFVIYNYLATTENITAEKLVQDFKSRYDISLNKEGISRILAEYVQSGVLSQRFKHFVFLNC
ncbi:MAG: hypothetical protein ACLTEH_02120 [Clostridia bacterium]